MNSALVVPLPELIIKLDGPECDIFVHLVAATKVFTAA